MRLTVGFVGFGALLSLLCGGCSAETKEVTEPPHVEEFAVQGEELSLLCGSSTQCNDGNACTLDLCLLGVCVHGPDLGCCQRDSDCHTDAVCSLVSCVLNTCIETPLLGCGDMSTEPPDDDTGDGAQLNILCSSDNDCMDSDPCTDNVCLLGICLFAPNPLCCEESSDCSGLVACHDGECSNNRCQLSLVPGCGDNSGDDTAVLQPDAGNEQGGDSCITDDDCDDGDPCTDDVCLVGGACVFSTSPLCCDESTDCDGILECHTGECINDRCSLTPVLGCGSGDTDATSAPTSESLADSTPPVTTNEATGAPNATSDDGTLGETEAPSATSTKPNQPSGNNGTTSDNSPTTTETDVDVLNADSSDASNTDSKEPSLSSDEGKGNTTAVVATNEASTSDEPPSAVTTDDEDTCGHPPVTTQLTGGACDMGALGRNGHSPVWLLLAAAAFIFGRRRK